MLTASLERIERSLGCSDLVLDVGGWASPLPRADWVIDLMPYETRGLYGNAPVAAGERFSAETWVERDICDRETWPFADNQFEFAICSHTLEDVRDPVWVCAELSRVAKAGYVETPSRLEEQSWGVTGPFVGWSHHHWLVEATAAGGLEFALKPHALHASPEHFLTADQRSGADPRGARCHLLLGGRARRPRAGVRGDVGAARLPRRADDRAPRKARVSG